jgi:hypothetical protein
VPFLRGALDSVDYSLVKTFWGGADAIFAPRLLLTLWDTDRLVAWVPKHSQAFWMVFQLLNDASDAAHG